MRCADVVPCNPMTQLLPAQVLAAPQVARLTVDQVHLMLAAGILQDGAPVELIDGVLLYKDRSARGEDQMSIGKKHALAVKKLARLEGELSPLGAHVQTQQPVQLSDRSEPEPDGAIVRGTIEDYADRFPVPADLGAVFEVADSSLQYDRTTKLELYAQAAIAQYVVINIPDECIEVYEDPRGGTFASKRVIAAGESFELRVSPEKSLPVAASSLLP